MRPLLLAAGLAALLLAACGADVPEPERGAQNADRARAAHTFDVETLADGFVRPTWAGAVPGDARALWLVEQTGRVLRLDRRGRRTVADVGDRIAVGAEQGLLGLAFHPGFARNRRYFLNYTDERGDTRVVERRLGSDRERVLLRVEQPEENHNGGHLLFGTDGRLYTGMGDGGGAFDPRDAAQDPGSPLGKLLAADVDAPGTPEWEVVMVGLRNPWRFWFDVTLNEVWIGDVGQDAVEEVDRLQIELDEPPKNLGWPRFEGERELGERALAGGHLESPVVTYTHAAGGCSVTAGLIYRGTEIAALSGRYVFGDFCSGALWTVRPVPGGEVDDVRRERARVPQLTHIGTDSAGELLMTTADGRLVRAVP